jgi:hypothetical protein
MQMISSDAGTRLAKETVKWDDPSEGVEKDQLVLASKGLVDAAMAVGFELIGQGFHDIEGS